MSRHQEGAAAEEEEDDGGCASAGGELATEASEPSWAMQYRMHALASIVSFLGARACGVVVGEERREELAV